MLNVTIQSHPIKRDWYKPNEKCLIVATINPISCSHPVHHGTFFNVLTDKFYSCKCREIIIFAHNYFKKQNTNEAICCLHLQYSIFRHKETRSFILLAINTHIGCANNSKCSVWCILKATARSIESVTLSIFC